MKNEWIKCSDKLPDKQGWYQVYRKGYEVHNSYYDKLIGWSDHTTMLEFSTNVTHWMPLPTKPLNK